MSPEGRALPGLHGRALTARRGHQVLFVGLDFDLPAGSLGWVRGPNGSGKTSLLRIVAGLLAPEAGRVLWGEQVLVRTAEFLRSMVFLGHSQGLKDDLSALEALQFLVHLQGRACSSGQAADALRQLGVHHRRHVAVRNLSQGQRKRVALARLVATPDTPLWILDEPLDALDGEGVACVTALLQSHVRDGGTVLLTSHIPLDLPGVAVHCIDVQAQAASVGMGRSA